MNKNEYKITIDFRIVALCFFLLLPLSVFAIMAWPLFYPFIWIASKLSLLEFLKGLISNQILLAIFFAVFSLFCEKITLDFTNLINDLKMKAKYFKKFMDYYYFEFFIKYNINNIVHKTKE